MTRSLPFETTSVVVELPPFFLSLLGVGRYEVDWDGTVSTSVRDRDPRRKDKKMN